MIKPLLLFFLLFSSSLLKAQDLGLQVAADYDNPLGEFAYKYQAVPAYRVDLLWFADDNNVVNFTIGYQSFKPKEDIFYYLLNDGEDYGTASFSNFHVNPVYMGWMHTFSVTEPLRVGAGFNFGAYFSQFTSTSSDKIRNSYESIGDLNAYLAAKAAISYDLTSRFQLNCQLKFNAFSPTGKNEARYAAFQDNRIGVFNYTWATGFGLAYKFF